MAELNETMSKIMDLMNYNKKMRNPSHKSMLDQIQTSILTSYYKSPSRTNETDDLFRANLVTNPNLMDEPEMYSGLEKVDVLNKGLFDDVREPMVINEQMGRSF